LDKKKINKNSHLSITITELEKAKSRIDTLVKKMAGIMPKKISTIPIMKLV
jgi:hypothetical protein